MTTPRSNIVRLRLTDLEKQDWQKAAGGARKLSEWIRSVCNAESERLRNEIVDAATSQKALLKDLPEVPEDLVALGAKAKLEQAKLPVSIPVIPNAKPKIIGDAIERSLHEHGVQDSGLAAFVRTNVEKSGPLTREVVEQFADQAHRESRPLPATEDVRGDDSSPPVARDDAGVGASAPAPSSNECPRWMHHRKGTYCGSCKRVIGK